MFAPLATGWTVALPAADARIASTLPDACGEDPNYLCERVFEITDGNTTAAQLTDWLIDRPISILLILVIAWISVRIARRAVDRLVRRIMAPSHASARRLFVPGLDTVRERSDPDAREREERMRLRRAARSESISAVLISTITVAIWVLALMLVLGELGVDLAPLIAGAGIAGVALGFGAQSLVKDCISGLFMLLEDQYGIGDVVDLGEATGVVEEVALRTTVLRGVDGTVWHVPNGEVIDIIQRTADEVCDRDEIRDQILDRPQVLGVEMLGADGITLRMTVTTTPGSQWGVQRQLRAALKSAFDAAEIDIPFPQRTVWLRNQES